MATSAERKIESLLKKEVEDHLGEFLTRNVPTAGFSGFFSRNLKYEDDLGDDYIQFYYPHVSRQDITENGGFMIEQTDHDRTDHELIYSGNFSIMIKVFYPRTRRAKPTICGYSYRFWYSRNTYQLVREKEVIDGKVFPFSFRLEQDAEGHSDNEYHSHLIHSIPRLHSRPVSVKDFLDYLKVEILPKTLEIENKVTHQHIALYS